MWCARALSRVEFDGVVPHTQHVILRIVGQPEEQQTAMRALNLQCLVQIRRPSIFISDIDMNILFWSRRFTGSSKVEDARRNSGVSAERAWIFFA